MISRSLFAAVLLASSALAGPPLTTIQDVLYKADGTRFAGTLTISWTSFEAIDKSAITAQVTTVTVTGGNLRVQLVPTTTAVPAASYTVKYNSDGRIQFSEIWAVPSSVTTLRVRDVRIAATPTGTVSSDTAVTTTTTVQESDVAGLIADLGARPLKGPGYAAGRVAVVNPTGSLESVTGSPSDCVRVDGSSGPCGGEQPAFVDGDSPSGIVDGSNTTFTLSGIPNPPSSLTVYRNGVLQTLGQDYTVAGNVIQFIAAAAPQPGDTLLASYRLTGTGAGTGTGTAGAPQGLVSPQQIDPTGLTAGQAWLWNGSSYAPGNVVDQTGNYINPAWITSLAYAKITGVPSFEPAIAAGTSSQYWRGDKTWQPFPTNVSSFSNDAGYLTGASSLAWAKLSGVPSFANSFNGRSGAVVPASGDYTAAQVTNAADITASYSNPSWISALAWAKLTGVPVIANTVFGRSGAVVAVAGDYTSAQVTESGNLYFTNARAQAAMAGLYQSPITIGTAAQYLRGDLSLATFPALPSGTGALKVVSGAAALVTGNSSDCVKVDGTSGSCGSVAGATPFYSSLYTSQTSVTIPGTTHHFATPSLAIMVYDNSTPRQLLAPDGTPPLTVDPSTYDVTVRFSVPTTFYVAINGGVGPQGPTGLMGPAGPTGPTGATGSIGPTGPAATINVGTVTTGAAGSSVAITNTGTTSAAMLNFTIPRGDTGASGTGSGDMTASTYDPAHKNSQLLADPGANGILKRTAAGTTTAATAGTDYIAAGGVALADLPTTAKVRTCEIVIGDPGAASTALADDNDSPAVCGNKTGATLTITAVECYANTGTPTVTPIITGGGATSILSGALTCGTGSFAAGTLNGSPTQANGGTIDANITTAGGTAKYIVIRITRTL